MRCACAGALAQVLQIQDDVRPLCTVITGLMRAEAAAQCAKLAKQAAAGSPATVGADKIGLAAKKRRRVAAASAVSALVDEGEAASLQLPAEGQALKSLHEFAVCLLTGTGN